MFWRVTGSIDFNLLCSCAHCKGHACPTTVISFVFEAPTAAQALDEVGQHDPSFGGISAVYDAIMALPVAEGMREVDEWDWTDGGPPTVEAVPEDQAQALRAAPELPGLDDMPKPPQGFELGADIALQGAGVLRLDWAAYLGGGLAASDSPYTVKINQGGDEVAVLRFGPGGSVTISDKARGELWRLTALQLWEVYQATRKVAQVVGVDPDVADILRATAQAQVGARRRSAANKGLLGEGA